MKNRFLILFLFLIPVLSFAQAPETKPEENKVKAPEKAGVFDFESDVIEGQKKTPELFLQLEMETTDLSAILYDRKNFNDFHAIDRKRRPLLSKPKP